MTDPHFGNRVKSENSVSVDRDMYREYEARYDVAVDTEGHIQLLEYEGQELTKCSQLPETAAIGLAGRILSAVAESRAVKALAKVG